MNERGQVVGYAFNSSGPRPAFISGPDGIGINELGYLNSGTAGEFISIATGVNATGRVVGYSVDGQGNYQAFATNPNGAGMKGLGFLNNGVAGNRFSAATGINASGQVVGYSTDDQGHTQAFLIGHSVSSMTGLGFLNNVSTGPFFSVATAINEVGQVVGYSYDSEYGENVLRPDGTPVSRYYQAFLTAPNGAGMTGLGFINPPIANLFMSAATGINASGQVVGSSAGFNNWSQAFLTGGTVGGLRGLGHLNSDEPGYRESFGRGINASGQVVGENLSSNYGSQAFVTGANGSGMYLLGELLGANGLGGWTIEFAAAISDNGYVAAFGYNKSTGIAPQALLVRVGEIPTTTVPEPASLALMASGLLALGVVVGRRKA